MKIPSPINDPITESPETQFRNAIINAGLLAPPEMTLDGAIHRYSDKPGDDAFWYVGHLDGIPGGAAGCWRTGLEITWRANIGRNLTPIEIMNYNARMVEAKKKRDEEKIKKNQDAAETVSLIWEKSQEASPDHPYLKTKDIKPHGARIVTDGRLIVPLFDKDGELSTLQYISADGKKLYHPGGKTKESFYCLGVPDKKVYLCEGFATGATIHEVTGESVYIAYSAHNLPDVAGIIREKHGLIQLVIVADNDKSGTGLNYATQATAKHGGQIIVPPIEGMDANDYRASGGDLAGLLNTKSGVIERMKVVKASDFLDDYEAPDEIIQGILVAKTLSVLYGDSNSGKTLFALKMAASIASGEEFLGRKVDKGGVLYLATEAPGSIKTRLQAIKKYHKWTLENLFMAPVPLNFYSNERDSIDVLELIKTIESENDIVIKLVIGDTLARMSSGANENSGEDMGPVMDRFSIIASESNAAVTIIHHNGKDAAKGARGWSGIRAHVDTELEVCEDEGNRTCTITKQRELSGKGEVILFDFAIVEMGIGKFGNTVSTCVVIEDTREPSEKVDKKTTEKIKDISDAWFDSGREILEGNPYVSRAALRLFLEERRGKKPDAITKMLQKSPDRLVGLLKNKIIIEFNDGFKIVDDSIISNLLLSI